MSFPGFEHFYLRHALERGVYEYNPLFGHFENCSYDLILIGQGSTHMEQMIPEFW